MPDTWLVGDWDAPSAATRAADDTRLWVPKPISRQHERRVATPPGSQGRRVASPRRRRSGPRGQGRNIARGRRAGVRDRDVPVRARGLSPAGRARQSTMSKPTATWPPGHEEGQSVVGRRPWTLRDRSRTFSIAPSSQQRECAPLVRPSSLKPYTVTGGADHADDDEEEPAQAVDAKREPGQRQEQRGERRRPVPQTARPAPSPQRAREPAAGRRARVRALHGHRAATAPAGYAKSITARQDGLRAASSHAPTRGKQRQGAPPAQARGRSGRHEPTLTGSREPRRR